ncbi:MAG: hypothetical protein RL562_1026 [Planctomycetota bacterium]|jgi:hypothetical protein
MPTTMVQAGAAFVPWASLDLDEKTRTQGTPSARLDDGEGWMIRTGSYDDALGVEFVLQTTEHDETASGSSLRTLAGYADLTQRFELWDGPISAWAGVGFGLGLMHFDWDGSYRSEVTGLWVGEGIFALQFGPHVSVETRIIGFSASHPGRSAGTGVLATIGGSIGF